jgi:hypothetical protein
MGRFPLFRKKERWTPTWQGRLVMLLILIFLVYLYTVNIVSFLSPETPVDADLLVVEGYMPDYALEEAMTIFNACGYDHMILTGKKREKGAHLDQYSDDGQYSAATLAALGFDPGRLTVVVTDDDISKDRTYHSALEVREWIQEHKPGTTQVDLVSMGTHSRRSWLLFQKAMGHSMQVGIYSIPNQSYDPRRWWRSSHGFREVNKETIAWVYARFFFWP